MTVADDDARFYFRLMSLVAFECRTPAAAVLGASGVLLRGEDDERREEMLEVIHEQSERLFSTLKLLTVASRTALGVLGRQDVSSVNARQIADQALASLASLTSLAPHYAATVMVSGEGVAVLADEWIEAGFASIVREIAHHRAENESRQTHQAELTVTVDGADISVSPVPTDDDLRRFVIGDDPHGSEAGLAVRMIRALGGSVDLDGDRLRFRFPEPSPSEPMG